MGTRRREKGAPNRPPSLPGWIEPVLLAGAVGFGSLPLLGLEVWGGGTVVLIALAALCLVALLVVTRLRSDGR